MSISDRLDETAARPVAWPFLDRADADKAALVAALRAVLDVCNETTIEARPHGDGEPYMIVPVREVHAAIEAALGEVQP